MGDPRKRRSAATCIAPVGEDFDENNPAACLEHTCGAVATQERAVDGIVFPLCDKHAAELDQDAIEDPELDVELVD